MSTIELTGLRAAVPIGAMVAFGVFRIATLARSWGKCRLRWTNGADGYYPVLETEAVTSADDLVTLLLENVREVQDREALKWTEQLKAETPEKFRQIADTVFQKASAGDRADMEWMSAIANELIADDGKIEPTPFDMSVARQKFPGDALKLASLLATSDRGRKQKGSREEFREALFGPWRYEDDQHSFGWDPSTVKLGAFTFKAPTLMANTGVRGAVWLAFESMPLFPVFAQRRRQRTRAFAQNGRRPVFLWPIWSPFITLYELECLLSSAALVGSNERAQQEFKSRGVLAIYRSEKFKPNKYMVTFRSAELAYSAAE
jgi:hypothetical protein